MKDYSEMVKALSGLMMNMAEGWVSYSSDRKNRYDSWITVLGALDVIAEGVVQQNYTSEGDVLRLKGHDITITKYDMAESVRLAKVRVAHRCVKVIATIPIEESSKSRIARMEREGIVV